MPLRVCEVSFKDHLNIRHTARVEAESLYEAVVLAVKRFREDPWLERVQSSTTLDVEIREPSAAHSLTLDQVERWLAGVTTSPLEASKKAKLKMILVQS